MTDVVELMAVGRERMTSAAPDTQGVTPLGLVQPWAEVDIPFRDRLLLCEICQGRGGRTHLACCSRHLAGDVSQRVVADIQGEEQMAAQCGICHQITRISCVPGRVTTKPE